MGNFGYLIDSLNELHTSWLEAYSTASGYSVDDLEDNDVTKPWRSVTAHPQWILIDMKNKITADLIALINHNLSSDAVITVTAGDDEDADDWAGSSITWRKNDTFVLLASAQSYRYWKISITDVGNVDGFIQIGHIVIGDSTTAAVTFAHNWEYEMQWENVNVPSDFGVPRVSQRFNRKRYLLPFDHNIDSSDADEITDLVEDVKRNVDPLFLIPDVTVTDGYFGRFTGNAPVRVPFKYQTILEFLEDSRGANLNTGQLFMYEPGDTPTGMAVTRASTAYYINNDRVLTQVAAGVVRDNHWPVRGTRVTLVESRAMTNGVTDPEDITTANWTESLCNAGPESIAGPDGSSTAYLLKEDDSSGFHVLSQNTGDTETDDTSQAISLFCKAAGRDHIMLRYKQRDNTSQSIIFDLTNETIDSNSDNLTTLFESLANGWYRIGGIFNSDSGGTNPSIQIFPCDSTPSNNYQGDGESGLYIWGVSHEIDRPYITSYHAGTRAQEYISFTYAHAPQQKTIYWAIRNQGICNENDASNARIIDIGDDASDPRAFVAITDAATPQITWQYDNIRVQDSSSVTPTGIAVGHILEGRCTFKSDGKIQVHVSVNGGSELSGSESTAYALASEWSNELIYLGTTSATHTASIEIISVKVLHGIQTMNTCRRAKSGQAVKRYAA